MSFHSGKREFDKSSNVLASEQSGFCDYEVLSSLLKPPYPGFKITPLPLFFIIVHFPEGRVYA